MQLLENLKWRYATKTFNPNVKVSSQNIELLKEVIRLSPSSYGLQPYKVFIIENLELREKLKEASWNQPQITSSSHIFVFCNYTELPKFEVENFISLTAKTQHIELNSLNNYQQLILDDLSNRTNHKIINWSKNQSYIAMSNLLNACAELKIDACPMEGFDNQTYNSLLELNKLKLNASVIVPIGYRSEDDHTQGRKKVRKLSEQIFTAL